MIHCCDNPRFIAWNGRIFWYYGAYDGYGVIHKPCGHGKKGEGGVAKYPYHFINLFSKMVHTERGLFFFQICLDKILGRKNYLGQIFQNHLHGLGNFFGFEIISYELINHCNIFYEIFFVHILAQIMEHWRGVKNVHVVYGWPLWQQRSFI